MTDQDPTQPFATPGAPEPSPVVPGATPAFAAPQATDPIVPAPTVPVEAAPFGPRRPRSRLRWLVALVVVLLVAGTAAGATLLLTAAPGDAKVLAWVPSDTVSYAELRLDLPGNQQTELAKLLSAFPGFADQSTLGTKIGEAMDELVGMASKDKHDYQKEIAPWFSGQVAVAQGPSPSLNQMQSGSVSQRMLLLALVTDPAKAHAWVDGLLTEVGAATTSDTYNGTSITIVRSGSGSDVDGMMSSMIPEMGYAQLGDVLAVGDVTSLKAAIDTKGTDGFAKDPQLRKAMSLASGDRLAFFYTDMEASFAPTLSMIGEADSDGTASAAMSLLTGLVPPWTAGVVRASGGNLVMDGFQPHVASFGVASNTTSQVAALAPADTVVLLDSHQLGAQLKKVRDLVAAQPKLAAPLKQVDDTLAILGGFDAITGWIGDTGVAITRNGDAVDGGLIIKPTDAASAGRLLTSIRGLVSLGAGQGSVTFTDEAYGDATITTVDLGSLGSMLGSQSGLGPQLSAATKLAYAVTDQVVVAGVNPDFVKAVLDARTGDSLAKQPRFASLLEKAGASNGGLVWVDVAAVRDLVEPLVPAADHDRYEKDIKPYLAPLDALVSSTVVDGDLDRSTVILSLSH